MAAAAACRAAFPSDRRYRVIYADPPWRYERACLGALPYPTMSLEELEALPVRDIADSDAALFLWTSNPMLESAFRLIRAWGFEYKTVFKVWSKRRADEKSPALVPGYWSMSSVELLLVASRGCMQKHKRVFNETQEFESTRARHSEKPHEIRESIERLLDADGCPHNRRIELFARHTCEGWDAWGLDVPGYLAPASAVSDAVLCERVVCFLDVGGDGRDSRDSRVRLLTRVLASVSRGTQLSTVAVNGSEVAVGSRSARRPAPLPSAAPAEPSTAVAVATRKPRPSRAKSAPGPACGLPPPSVDRVPVRRLDNGVLIKGLAKPARVAFSDWWHGKHRVTGVLNSTAYEVPREYLDEHPDVRALVLGKK